MDSIFRIFSKEYININQAAFLLGTFAFLSQILALFRDRSIAHFIGPTSSLDIYYASFRVPDLIFISVASLASITVLVPFVVGRMKDGKMTKSASQYLDSVFTVFFIVMVVVAQGHIAL
jgi:peptidoglycan biosynthesis protein MviN/MurJ (putative lipid II flippase)